MISENLKIERNQSEQFIVKSSKRNYCLPLPFFVAALSAGESILSEPRFFNFFSLEGV
jgi:hypothetical protein